MPIVKNPILKKLRKEASKTRTDWILAQYKEGRPVVEIAAELDLNRSTIYAIISRGQRKCN